MLNTRTSTYQSQINFFVKPLQNQESPSKKCANAYTYGFNGKERDSGFGSTVYDYGARIYVPRYGRWMSPDALAFKMSSWSPFSYSFDNPIYYIDPDGNIPFPVPLKYVKNKTFVWGRQASVGNNDQEYGYRESKKRMHYGLDFNIGSGKDDLGIPLLNLADGRVIGSGTAANGGNYIIIRHSSGYITRYFHMQDKPSLITGDEVKEGQEIGKIGDTFGYNVHGHLEIAKLADEKVSDEIALDQFLSNDFHINPREVIGDGSLGNGGDLQIIANGGKKEEKTGLNLPSGSTYLSERPDKGLWGKITDFFKGTKYDDDYFETLERYHETKKSINEQH